MKANLTVLAIANAVTHNLYIATNLVADESCAEWETEEDVIAVESANDTTDYARDLINIIIKEWDTMSAREARRNCEIAKEAINASVGIYKTATCGNTETEERRGSVTQLLYGASKLISEMIITIK